MKERLEMKKKEKRKKEKNERKKERIKQGQIHGQYQLQGWKGGFSHFSTRSSRTNGPMERWTNGQTDKASYRVACPQKSKMVNFLNYLQLLKLMIRSKENGYQHTQMSC